MNADESLDEYLKTKEGLKLAETLMHDLLTSAIEDGRIKAEGKSEVEIGRDFALLLSSYVKSPDREILWTIDYRNTVLLQGRLFFKAGDYRLASLLYGTWFEHWLNWLISIVGKRRGLHEDEITQLIRDAPFRGKLTWMFPLLGLRHLAGSHRNAIFKISDLRNNFVHYKWKGKDDASGEREEKELVDCLSAIEKTVKYLQSYENKYIFHRKKKAIKKLIKITK